MCARLRRRRLTAQTRLDNAKLLKPGTDSWPTFNGDYTGRRFSPLTKITPANAHQLSLAWMFRTTFPGVAIKSTPLLVNGVLYFTIPDHVWAVDARTGRQLWHYQWQTTGGNHLGNRGVAIYEDWLYFETPDCYLISLNVKDGSERWRKQICDIDRFYYASAAPTVVKDHVIVGVSGDDFDIPGYIQAVHPESGEMQWRFYTVPQKKGEPGSESWPNEEMAAHGGGMTWQPITYDPELNLVFVTTGNPQPVIAHKNRPGDNLFTGSIVAVNADTGKMAWYFQSSPHDTHDWDSTQTAVLIDDEVNGQKRKLIAQAARNGHYFLLDRATGKAIVSSEYVKSNWWSGYDKRGQPIPKPEKMPQIRRRAGVAEPGRRHQLAVAELQPADRPVLRQRGARLQHLLHLRPEREPDGMGRLRSRRLVGVDAAGDRLQDRQGALDAQVGRQRRPLRHRHHRRQRALHRRAVERSRRAECGHRRRAVALDAERLDQQRPDHLRARRAAIRRRRRRRHALDVRVEYGAGKVTSCRWIRQLATRSSQGALDVRRSCNA